MDFKPDWLKVKGRMSTKATNIAGVALALGAAVFLVLAGVALVLAAL